MFAPMKQQAWRLVSFADCGRHFFQQFTGPMTAWWKALGSPVLTPEIQKTLIDGLHEEACLRSITELETQRDEILLGLLELRDRFETSPATASKTAGTN
jgi:hypothetical protein